MIVDSLKQYQDFLKQIAGNDIVCHAIVLHPQKHLIDCAVIGWYIRIIGGEEFTILIEHPEAVFKIDAYEAFEKAQKCYVIDYDILTYAGYKLLPNMEDAVINSYLAYGTIPEQEYNPLLNFFKKRVGQACSNFLIDIVKLQQYYRELVDRLPIKTYTANEFYNTVKEVYHRIEKNGIALNQQLYKEVFHNSGYVKDGKAYTKYNLYTSTGRPSNRFAGVNYAALNKEDNTRECFVSRYSDGILVEVDFTSYHPRILADITRYQISDDENIYEHLAKEYFGANPTKEQIAEAKEMTFRQLYGGISRQYQHIEYFARIQAATDMLWKLYQEQGFITSIISKRRISNIDDASPTKLLNYLIQLHETEQNVTFLSQIFKQLDEDILPVLYTYDSVLFDLPKSKEDDLLTLLRTIIPSKYPFKIKIGDNYKYID